MRSRRACVERCINSRRSPSAALFSVHAGCLLVLSRPDRFHEGIFAVYDGFIDEVDPLGMASRQGSFGAALIFAPLFMHTNETAALSP